MNDTNFMEQALEMAGQAYAAGEVPIGAVVVHNGEVIAAARNRTEEITDPTAHAELLVIGQACKVLKTPRLVDCDLYVTLEPCPMCAQAISFARIRRLYFGAYDLKGGGVDHGPNIFNQASCHHKPEVYGGIMESESMVMLKEFFKERR